MASSETPTAAPKSPSCGNCEATTKADGSPLSRCGRCKLQSYCSTDCQKSHWSAHKVACKGKAASGYKPVVFEGSNLRDDAIMAGPGIMIQPFPMTEAKGGYGFAIWPATNRDTINKALQYPFSDLAIGKAVGFPLRLTGTSHGDINAPNEHTEVLGINIDPHSPYFGKSCWEPKPTGTALVVRPDLKDLHINQVTALVQFCYMAAKEAKKLRKKEAKGEKVDKHELAVRLLNPQAFKRFFDDMKETERHNDPKSWEGVKCPMEVS